MKRKLLRIKVLLPLLLLVVVLAGIYMYSRTLQGRMGVWGIKISTGNMHVTDSYREISGTNKIDWIEAQDGDMTMFIGRVFPQDVQKFINDKIYSLMALYEPSTSPYPEVITNIITCPDDFKPHQIQDSRGSVYKLFAGERFGYGICTNDLIKYQSLLGMFDCGGKGVFEIKLFDVKSADRIQGVMNSFACGN